MARLVLGRPSVGVLGLAMVVAMGGVSNLAWADPILDSTSASYRGSLEQAAQALETSDLPMRSATASREQGSTRWHRYRLLRRSSPLNSRMAAQQLRDDCAPAPVEERSGTEDQRSLEVEDRDEEGRQLTFTCTTMEGAAGVVVTRQYQVALATDGGLRDFRTLEVHAKVDEERTGNESPAWVKQTGVVAIGVVSVGLSVLVSNQFARKFYPAESDKPKHAMAGALIAGVTTGLSVKVFKRPMLESFLMGVGASLAAALAKELLDTQGFGHVEGRDVAATVEGGMLGAMSGLTFAVEF